MCGMSVFGNPIFIAIIIPYAICEDIIKYCKKLLHLDQSKQEPAQSKASVANQSMFSQSNKNNSPSAPDPDIPQTKFSPQLR